MMVGAPPPSPAAALPIRAVATPRATMTCQQPHPWPSVASSEAPNWLWVAISYIQAVSNAPYRNAKAGYQAITKAAPPPCLFYSPALE